MATRNQAQFYKNYGAYSVAKKGEYLFSVKGVGQPSLATKNIPVQDFSKFVPKPTKGFSKTPFKFVGSTKQTAGFSSTGNKGVSKTKAISNNLLKTNLDITPTINTVTIKPAVKATLFPLKTLGTGSVLAVGTLGAVMNRNKINTVTANKIKVKQIQQPKIISIVKIKSVPSLVSTQTTTPFTPTPLINIGVTTPAPINPLVFGGLQLPTFGFDGGKNGYGNVGAKAKYGYTPSYTALAFGITGKKQLQNSEENIPG